MCVYLYYYLHYRDLNGLAWFKKLTLVIIYVLSYLDA